MTPQEIADVLKSAFPQAILEAVLDSPHPHLMIAPAAFHDVALFLRDDPRLAINMLRCVSALDLLPEPSLEVVYDLMSMRPDGDAGYWRNHGEIALKVRVPRADAHVRSVADVWPTADWHEREAFDLLGVTFDQHPDPRRILCPDDWVGHPLRKDYEFPTEYQGIPCAATDAK